MLFLLQCKKTFLKHIFVLKKSLVLKLEMGVYVYELLKHSQSHHFKAVPNRLELLKSFKIAAISRFQLDFFVNFYVDICIAAGSLNYSTSCKVFLVNGRGSLNPKEAQLQ